MERRRWEGHHTLDGDKRPRDLLVEIPPLKLKSKGSRTEEGRQRT